mmetsp:Transcript_100235/g.198795  ORF Transcript_100235/g.198795 Transcript_100235/m.198795 type:complete len:118 (+) Transcript_100235:50-403(+)
MMVSLPSSPLCDETHDDFYSPRSDMSCEGVEDTVCSICQKRILQSEIGWTQGVGMSSFDTVEVVECATCIAKNRKFVRQTAPQDSRPKSDKRMQYEEELRAAQADRNQLQEQLNASK